ncbi:MAG: L-2-hydroxyglutarate oxidase [Candidatus Omnitrophica bacterium]|nr:L-2-hydroxyglutarate oxidase [Candidatus Omnitrophota bacterium]
MKPKSFLVVGGGIIGTAIAREILLRKLGDVTILEKEDHLAEHASGRNSGVIHSGINQRPGSLKARMCLEGSKRLREFCRDHDVPMRECGTIVAAQNESDEKVLDQLLEMGRAVGVPKLQILSREELNEREPDAIGTKALLSPTGAVVDSRALLKRMAEEVMRLGGHYEFSACVTKINLRHVITNQTEYSFDHLINCAGLYSDQVAHQMGVGLEYTIIPFRGEYMEIKNSSLRVQSMVYQVPDLRFPFLSVHLTREADGKLLAGPTAALSFGRESYKKEFNWCETGAMFLKPQFWGLLASKEFMTLAWMNAKISFSVREFLKEIQKICPKVSAKDIMPYRAGIRAQMVDRRGKMVNDLVVKFCENSTHVLNAVSPGMTASLAFAEYVVNGILPPHLSPLPNGEREG